MNHINKICFAYPVVYHDGMSKEQSCIPSTLISGFAPGTEIKILVTVGLMISLKAQIHINVEVNRKDIYDPVDKSNGNGRFENLKTDIIGDGQAIVLTSLHLDNVLFEESGEYEIRVNLFGSDNAGNKIHKPIDSYRSYFYFLAKEKD